MQLHTLTFTFMNLIESERVGPTKPVMITDVSLQRTTRLNSALCLILVCFVTSTCLPTKLPDFAYQPATFSRYASIQFKKKKSTSDLWVASLLNSWHFRSLFSIRLYLFSRNCVGFSWLQIDRHLLFWFKLNVASGIGWKWNVYRSAKCVNWWSQALTLSRIS